MIKDNSTPYAILKGEFDLLVDEPMMNYTSFKIGDPADLLAMPEDKAELKHLVKKARQFGIPVTLLGGGTNILVSDKGIRGLVIITTKLKSKIKFLNKEHDTSLDRRSIVADAGESLSKVCRFAIDNNLSGLEFAAGIPGTLGGAITMNAGTKSGDMSSVVKSVEVLDIDSFTLSTIDGNLLNFSYRHLDLSGIIVSAAITLKKGNHKKIEQTFKENLNRKITGQPLAKANAGCFFKNPVTDKTAGELIDKSGLKGFKINDAMVSKKHGNFIVNLGNARCRDILLLKKQIQQKVFAKFNIKLETEVRIKGE